MDDLDIITDALRFLASKAGGIEQLPFDPFAAIGRLRSRVLPELPHDWRIITTVEGRVSLVRQRKSPPRCWQVWGDGATFAAAVSDALAKIGPDGFPFDDPEDEGIDYESLGWEVPSYLRRPVRGEPDNSLIVGYLTLPADFLDRELKTKET
jgi:hypothetical protein